MTDERLSIWLDREQSRKGFAVGIRSFYAVGGVIFAMASLAGCQTWQPVYEDSYSYTTSAPLNPKFNTWFWREDAVGTHVFNYTDTDGKVGSGLNGCTADAPCVKLEAPIYSAPTGKSPPYINAEMYNNSCVRQGPGHPDKQPFDRLLDPVNPLVQSISFIPPSTLHANIEQYCDMPYPYRDTGGGFVPGPYATDAWNTTTPADIAHNFLALLGDNEAPWEWYRDLGFNNIYLADDAVSNRIVANIRADGEGGGSRGWGYWNTTMNPLVLQFAWFMEITTQKKPNGTNDPGFDNNVWMMTVRGGEDAGFCLTLLDPEKHSIYDWHQYSIEWTSKSVQYFVDDALVADHAQYIPDIGLAFHNWVDNRNYGKYGPANYPLETAKSNLINQFTVYEKKPSGGDAVSMAASGATQCQSFASLGGHSDLNTIDKLVGVILEAYK